MGSVDAEEEAALLGSSQLADDIKGSLMRRAYRLVVALGSIHFLLTLYIFIAPGWLSVPMAFLTLMSLALALLVTAILGFVEWRKSSRLWMAPALLCLTFMSSGWIIPPPIGRAVRDWRFTRHLDQYNRVVDGVRNGAISCSHGPCGAEFDSIDVKYRPPQVRTISAARCSEDAVVVVFLIDADVPLLHHGYVYRRYTEADTCVRGDLRPERRWPYLRHVVGDWYHFSDQPEL